MDSDSDSDSELFCMAVNRFLGIMSPYQKNTIRRLQRTTPLYKRPRGHMCPRHRRGGCPRGPECPYAVGMPTGDKEKDIWYRVNSPEAMKLLLKKRAVEMPPLEPPDDKSIKILHVSGLDMRITEPDLRDNFNVHGEIETLKMVPSQGCAFVTYTTRESAEKAAKELSNKLVIKGLRLKLMWAMPQPPKPDSVVSEEARPASSGSQQ